MACALGMLGDIAFSASQAPTLSYSIINNPKLNGPPLAANNYTSGCSGEKRCSGYYYLVSIINIPSGTRIDASATVEGVNSSENGTEAIAYAIAEKSFNKTKDINANNNAYGSLSISLEGEYNDASHQMSQLNAVSRGISRLGLDSLKVQVQVQKYSTSSSTEATEASSTLADWTIRVHKVSEWVAELKLLTNVTNLEKNDMKDILERARAMLPEILK
ncbi:phosphomannomutase/phosphoglucomutase-like protein [Corchorus olitorius]|uniref:Phosphomannomutase/phosphoglucomutase-like protein n=1 Tax=Corchorus olitorius TaxID=93759 RepID=A0A1R3IFI7_9ROSI|nr:phosphomannomutase/phosphoglucomutase-like protein [Corchorus olitorius]